jgi:hypothetical protein
VLVIVQRVDPGGASAPVARRRRSGKGVLSAFQRKQVEDATRQSMHNVHTFSAEPSIYLAVETIAVMDRGTRPVRPPVRRLQRIPGLADTLVTPAIANRLVWPQQERRRPNWRAVADSFPYRPLLHRAASRGDLDFRCILAGSYLGITTTPGCIFAPALCDFC